MSAVAACVAKHLAPDMNNANASVYILYIILRGQSHIRVHYGYLRICNACNGIIRYIV